MSYCYELILHLNQLLSLFIVPVTLKQLTTSLITTAKLSILDVCGGFSLCLCLHSSFLQHVWRFKRYCPAGIHLFKISNRNTKARCEIWSKLTIKTQEQRHWCRSSIFIVNFKHISRLALMFLLLTLNIYLPAGE